ncbi:dTMP kinase [Candidatus Poriferisodalis sp.]|uniref:dTMP kinase n=1 Tax=Candidatus Poriferisodalis sp. TaxID=3101277 RepID=UPI003B02D141
MSIFVAIDGPNGVGKTTIVSELAGELRSRGADVLTLRQPSDSELGRFARSFESRLSGLSLAILVVADRLVQVATDIEPALAEGRIVLCDRHIASTLVLQRLDGLDLPSLWQMNADVLMPDLQVILLASPEVLRSRLDARSRSSRFEQSEGIEEREVHYYEEAIDWLKSKGLSVITADTGGQTVDETAAFLAGAIGKSLESGTRRPPA